MLTPFAVTEVCRRDLCVRGNCRDRLSMHDRHVSVIADANGQVFMSPTHKRTYECLCQEGYGGTMHILLINTWHYNC